MADVVKAVRFVLLGDEKGATKALHGVSKGAVAMGAALAAGVGIAIKFGNDSIKAFQGAAGEAAKLSRITGMTAEDSSRLGFAMKQTGIDVAAGTKAMTILGKTLEKAAGSEKSAAAITDALGFAFTDASGGVRDMSELLPEIADRFAKMDNGSEKTALALKLFGKSGADLVPLLNKGSEGLAELAAKSDAFGNTISGSMLDKLKASKQAQRDWDAAMQGLQVTLGSELLPLLTQGATLINQQVIPAIKGATNFFRENEAALGPLIGTLGTVGLVFGGVVLAAKGLEALKATAATISGVKVALLGMSAAARVAVISTGAVGIALTVAAGIWAAFAGKQAEAKAAADDYAAALKADNEALGENVRLTVAKRLEDSGALANAQKLGIGLQDMTDAILGQGDAAQRVGDQIQYYYTGWRTNSDITSDQVKASQDLRGVVAAESTELRNAAASNQRVAQAAGAAAGATDGQTTATTAATTAIQLATTATQQQVAADKEAIQAKLTLSGSLIGLEGAFDDAMAAAKKNGKTLDINTAAGRANRTALDGIAASALTTKESLEKNHASQKRVNGVMGDARTQYIKAAMAMGKSRDRAKEMADNIGLIKSKTVTVKTKFEKTGPTSWTVRAQGGARVSVVAVAKGGIIRAFAAGGIERHDPRIYRSHDGARLFNEPETEGESYIPLANDWRRPRALAVWRQTGRELGAFAAGGVVRGGGVAGAGVMQVQIDIKVDRLTDTTKLGRELRDVLLDLKRGPLRGRGLGLA